MNHKEFEEMVERLRANTKTFSNIETEITEEGTDRVTFDYKYASVEQMDIVKKRLRIARFPDAFPDGSPTTPMMKGKITICEIKKCSECGQEVIKNVTRELGALLQGVPVKGWT